MKALHLPETTQRKSFVVADNSSNSSKPKFSTEQPTEQNRNYTHC